MTKKHPKIAFLYPGQGAVPEEPGGNYDETPEIGALYDSLAIPRYRPFDNFHQKAEIDDLEAQLGVFFTPVFTGDSARVIYRSDLQATKTISELFSTARSTAQLE